MNNAPSNRLPLILAIALHIILFSALFIHFASPDTRNLQLQPEVDIIKAVAVNPAEVAAQVTRIKAAEEQEKQRKAAEEAAAAKKLQQEKLREQEQVLQRQKQAQEKAQEKAMQQKVAEQKAAQQKAEAAALLEQQQEEQKQLAEKATEEKQQVEKIDQAAIEKEERAKKVAEKKQKAATALKLAQQKALENEMAAEKKQLDAARTNQQQSEIDKYTALILHTMRQNWMVPEGVNPTISCQLAIRLNADGTVVSVTLLRSSGNAALDNSARLAVFKSSPLPVPEDTALFNEVFRQFNLTVSPKDIE